MLEESLKKLECGKFGYFQNAKLEWASHHVRPLLQLIDRQRRQNDAAAWKERKF